MDKNAKIGLMDIGNWTSDIHHSHSHTRFDLRQKDKDFLIIVLSASLLEFQCPTPPDNYRDPMSNIQCTWSEGKVPTGSACTPYRER